MHRITASMIWLTVSGFACIGVPPLGILGLLLWPFLTWGMALDYRRQLIDRERRNF